MDLNCFILITFLCLLLSSFAYSLRYACPTDPLIISNLSPCSCNYDKDNFRVIVKCSGISEPIKLTIALSQLSGYKIDDLIISSAALGSSHLPEDPFLDGYGNVTVEIETITITGSAIGNIAGAVHKVPVNTEYHTFFSGLGSSLKVIRIESTKGLASWSWDRLANSLSTGLNSSIDLTTGSCTQSLALNTIILYNNEITELPPTFDSLGNSSLGLNPEKVILRSNKLTMIYASLIFNNMKFLDLSSNLIESTGLLGLFLNASNLYQIPEQLESIYLNDNKLITLAETRTIWESIGQQTQNNDRNRLKYINLKDNPIDCSCSTIHWMANRRLPPILDGTCAVPSSIKGKLLSSNLCA